MSTATDIPQDGVTDIDPFQELGGDETTHEAEVEIPNFAKMKKSDITDWVKENIEEDSIPEGFFDLGVKDMRASLKALLADDTDVEAPATTGFDVNDLICQTVADIEKIENEQDAREAILNLMDESEFSFFKIGGILARFKIEGWTGEFDTFPEFVESVFGFKIRKAETLILIYQSLTSCGAPWAEAKAVGWAKLGVIAKFLTTDNWKDWFAKAKDVSHASVVEMAKEASASKKVTGEDQDAPESTPVKKLSIAIHEDQEVNIKDAFEMAKEKLGSESDGQALHAIALDYMATPVAMQANPEPEAQKDEEGEEAEDLLEALFTAIREGADFQEGLELIHSKLTEVYPEVTFEISMGDGDDSES